MLKKSAASVATQLASWASEFIPSNEDLALAQRSLVDTVAVTLAARRHPLRRLTANLAEPAQWAAVGHVLDFDDLHMDSTAHVSVVCVPAVLTTGGDARAYLAGAGVMARLGSLLGWPHYVSGWHATCTAGAPAAAVAASVALGFNADQIARAMALAVPAAGGVQRAFGYDSKSLQVGFATEAGVRAAHLVAAGATVDPRALDQWLTLVGAGGELDLSGPAIPGGLAIKLYPCCYALQRPMSAMQQFGEAPERMARIVVRTPEPTVRPLIHHRPVTGLQGKFSLEYAMAAVALDHSPDFVSFDDAAVNREAARRLVERVDVVTTPGGTGLLDGVVEIDLTLTDGTMRTERLAIPPGAPGNPPTSDQLRAKLAGCGADIPALLAGLTWSSAATILREHISVQSDIAAGALVQ